MVFRKKLQQNKQSQNAASKPKVKRHRTDLDRLYVEYQVVSNPLSLRRKPKNTIVFFLNLIYQEKLARREAEAKEEELMVKSGKVRLHTREVIQLLHQIAASKPCLSKGEEKKTELCRCGSTTTLFGEFPENIFRIINDDVI